MQENFLITIKGTMEQRGDSDTVELMTRGSLVHKEGAYYIVYKETEATGYEGCTTTFATAPALIVVGFYMMGAVAKINFDDMTDAIPAFLTILVMPLAYSISEGIAIGIISWTLINVLTGKAKEKKITPLMYVLTVLFILKYIFL